MKLIPVDPNDVPNITTGMRGRVSYPIIKQFLESNSPISQLDRTGMQQSLQGLYSSLNSYAKNHNMPIKIIARNGEIYLCRLDINADGTPNPDYKPGNKDLGGQYTGTEELTPAQEITPAVVAERHDTEKDQVTK